MATEYIGQTINLTSKSQVRRVELGACWYSASWTDLSSLGQLQIRYQGTLHSIDPNVATISLEKGEHIVQRSWSQARLC